MQFSVKKWGKGGCRSGILQFGNCWLETPALLLTTRKGLPTFITPDLLNSLPTPDSRLFQFSPLHFTDDMSLETISALGGLHKMVNLQEHVFAAIPRDSILSLPDYQSTNKMGASFETPYARRLITPVHYMQMISSMKPNIWASLPDEVPAWVSEKRNKLSVDRTVRWLDECITSTFADYSEAVHALVWRGTFSILLVNKKTGPLVAFFVPTISGTGGAVFGSIVGGSKIDERKRCAEEVAMRNVSGFCIGGFGLGESMDERPALIRAVTESLPEDKPRQMSGLGLPEDVLQGVAAGIDLFDSTYIYHLTLGGFALTFSSESGRRHDLGDHGGDGTKVNLKSTIYRKDTSPILEGCKCYTCQNHTKAYINHLLNVHEMLAQILLEIHNTHHYLAFFRTVREAIRRGTFEEFRLNFVENRRDQIIAAVQTA